MPKNDISEILLVDQPGNDKLCRIRTSPQRWQNFMYKEQSGCLHDVQNGCSSGTRSDKQIQRKILHVYMDPFFSFFFFFFFFFFFSSPALFENPRGDRNYRLWNVRRSRKGMPQTVKSIRLRNRCCGLFMQKGNRIAVEWKDWTISANFFACMAGWIIYIYIYI